MKNSSKNKLNKALTIILTVAILLSIIFLIYIIITPHKGEKFTEFYLLGPDGNATGYPSNLTIGENESLIIGIVNHEYKTVNYTVEIWLINQTTTEENETVYHNMWYMNIINVTLNHTPIDIEERWKSQWEYNYIFNINQSGLFKLAFLLYTEPTENYSYDKDYKDIAKQKIDSTYSTAYRTLHLWINVHL